MDKEKIVRELRKLAADNCVHFQGTIKLVDANPDTWLPETESIEIQEEIYLYGGIRDRNGPFVMATVQEKPRPVEHEINRRVFNISGDIAPYSCPVSGRVIDGRAEHKENLKRTGSRLLEAGEVDQYRKEKPKRQAEEISRMTDKMINEVVSGGFEA